MLNLLIAIMGDTYERVCCTDEFVESVDLAVCCEPSVAKINWAAQIRIFVQRSRVGEPLMLCEEVVSGVRAWNHMRALRACVLHVQSTPGSRKSRSHALPGIDGHPS